VSILISLLSYDLLSLFLNRSRSDRHSAHGAAIIRLHPVLNALGVEEM
jgi:hypothetical protein